jgi:hypothetical protein
MLALIPDLPARVVGIQASGVVTAKDYETVLVPAIEARLSAFDRIRVLYQLGPEFTGFSAGALWDDMKVGAAHLKAWERIAVVTDAEWVVSAVRLFRFAVPCPVRLYPNAGYAEALHWIEGD